MAISVLKHVTTNNDHGGDYAEFICDGSGDIENLPTTEDSGDFGFTARPGSAALICNSSAVFVLSPSGTWVQLEVN